MDYGSQLNLVKKFVLGLFSELPYSTLAYHNFDYTLEVVKRCYETGSLYSLDEEDLFILLTAAWFRDSGQLLQEGRGHEQRSANVLTVHADHLGISPALLERIGGTILASDETVEPASLLEKIIRDADTYPLETSLFKQTEPLVRKEIELLSRKVSTNWFARSVKPLVHHRNYVDYCARKPSEEKTQYIARLAIQK